VVFVKEIEEPWIAAMRWDSCLDRFDGLPYLIPRDGEPAPLGRPVLSWIRVETESDIEALQEFTNDFHDAYLCEMHYLACGTPRGRRLGVSEPDSTILRLFFQLGTVDTAVELLLKGTPRINLAESNWWVSSEWVDQAFVSFRGPRTVWAVGATTSERLNSESFWVAGDRMFWRDASEWTGNQLRYLNRELDIVQEIDLP